MTAPMVPHRFVDGSVVDPEKVNDNLEAIARDVNRNLAKRYTYSTLTWSLNGVTAALAQVRREFAIRRPASGKAMEIVGVELAIYTTDAGAATWTLTCSDTTWPAMTLTTTVDVSGATENYTAQYLPVSIPSHSADVTFTLAGTGGATITGGNFVFHVRCDRGNQGSSHAGYTPALIDASSSTAGSVLDTQLTAAETAVSTDTANSLDMRVECYLAGGVSTGQSIVFRMPSGVRRLAYVHAYSVGAATESFDVTLTGTGLTFAGISNTCDTVTTRNIKGGAGSGTMNDDPTDTADDATLTFTNTGPGTILLLYALVWWS